MILMIGLPSCGKTYTSRRLAKSGDVLIEFDEYFYTQVGSRDDSYDWSERRLRDARKWNLERILTAIQADAPRIIIDSDNGVHAYTSSYVEHGLRHGYEVVFQEPESPWWAEIRDLLCDREANRERLRYWARKLATMNKGSHRVPQAMFERRIARWQNNVTVEHILAVSTSAKLTESDVASPEMVSVDPAQGTSGCVEIQK